jgi:ATP-dependent DNA ligase
MYTRVVAIGGTFYTWDQAWAYARSVQDSGNYDGAVLRNPYAPWVVGRSKGDIIKLKPLVDFDLTVLRVEKAVGGKTGRVTCALVCKWRNGEEQKVATGLDHDQQDNPEQFVGKVIRVAGMGLTNTGKIREPRFMGEREDTLPDY